MYIKMFCLLIWFKCNNLRIRIWNMGIKMLWNRLWIRKNKFHKSLSLDVEALSQMDDGQREAYMKNMAIRRQAAHEKDLLQPFE